MSQFDADFAAAASPALQTVFGEAVTYTPLATGVPASITARVERGSETVGETEQEGRQAITDARVTVLLSDVSVPARGDVVTFDSKDYKVERIDAEAGKGEAILDVVLIAPEFKEPGIRRNARG